MPLSEAELEHLSYREVVDLAKAKGVYQKKSAKKAALIRRLSSIWNNEEFTGIENVDPLTPLKEVDESIVEGSDGEELERRKTFTKVNRRAKSKTLDSEMKSTEPPKRQNTFTKSDSPGLSGTKVEVTPLKEVDDSIVEGSVGEELERRKTFTKVKRRAKSETLDSEVKSTEPPKRQNTFTKPEGSADNERNQNEIKALVREGTFTKTPEKMEKDESILDGEVASSSCKKPERGSGGAGDEGLVASAGDGVSPERIELAQTAGRRTRRNTFTSSPQTTSNAKNDGSREAKSLVREGIFNMTPEKKEHEIPVLQLNTPKVHTPIDKLSVFQRLSVKIPLSERRSLVMSEKRGSLKTNFSTPQSHKRSQLHALREGRKSHMTPKSLTKKMAVSAMKTPAQQVIKPSAASTKKSSVKKPPNFAEIHKRNFAKMESLLEHKSRLRERAEFMSPGFRAQTTRPIPKCIESGSGLTKSGGKKSNIPILLKKMATKDRLKMAMAKKCSTGAVKLDKDKKILKGVRTNKRFELQLAHRKNMI